jgi:hypothetical protein
MPSQVFSCRRSFHHGGVSVLIEPFAVDWLEQLCLRHKMIPAPHRLYMLIDGAFVPTCHRLLLEDEKRLLFEALPACSDETKDVSPILVQFDPDNPRLTKLLSRCDRWPMVSVIETPESINALYERLSAWCVVHADGQRFNFRFPDTRRLPTILNVLDDHQRGGLAGSAVRWSYVGRYGRWVETGITPRDTVATHDPELNQHQFAMLVEDSRADEILSLLSRRGHRVYDRPSISHALVEVAIKVAQKTRGDDSEMISWCEWFWQRQKRDDETVTTALFTNWSNLSGGGDA